MTLKVLEVTHRRFEGIEAAVYLCEDACGFFVVVVVGLLGDDVGCYAVDAGYQPFIAEYADVLLCGGHGHVVSAADVVVGRERSACRNLSGGDQGPEFIRDL